MEEVDKRLLGFREWVTANRGTRLKFHEQRPLQASSDLYWFFSNFLSESLVTFDIWNTSMHQLSETRTPTSYPESQNAMLFARKSTRTTGFAFMQIWDSSLTYSSIWARLCNIAIPCIETECEMRRKLRICYSNWNSNMHLSATQRPVQDRKSVV